MPLKSSKLCKSFPEILRDTSSLSTLEYFLQYMESLHAAHLVEFWLTVESFKATVLSPKVHKGDSVDNHINRTPHEASSCERNTECDITTGNAITKDTSSELLGKDKLAGDDHGQNKVLQRRDTEHFKYCNCKIVAESPQSFKKNSVDTIHDGNRVTFHHACEHGSPMSGESTRPPDFVASGQQVPNHIKSENHILTLETDAIGIYSKYLALNATNPVGVSDEIRQRIEVNICPEDGKIDHSCYNEAQDYVYNLMEKRYYQDFLHSSFLCKYQLDYIASGNLNLMDFLLGENALFYFMEYMEQEGASSLLQFWLTAENFYNQLSSPDHSPDIEADTADAIAIYDRYFSLQATDSLKMEDSVRLDVENRVCDEHGPRADSFLRPQLVAFHTINEVHYPGFMDSSIYLGFLNELVHMLNKEDESAQADPLNGTTRSNKPVQRSVSQLSHILVGKDLDDPDSLWERPHLEFRLGFINEYGEYISEIDPAPLKKDSTWSISARALRRRRKEEELSMKIARNIIKEVFNCLNS